MKMRPIASAAALVAALAGGAVAHRTLGPGATGVADQVEFALQPADGATPAPEPSPTTTPPEFARAGQPPFRLAGNLDLVASAYTVAREVPLELLAPPEPLLQYLRRTLGRERRHFERGQVYGAVEAVLTDDQGNLRGYWYGHNLVVDAGKNAGVRAILGSESTPCPTTTSVGVACGPQGICAGPPKFNYVGIGTNGAAESAAQTGCLTEVGTRQQDTIPDIGPTTGQGKLIVTFGSGNPAGGGTIAETCLMNALTSGSMFSRRIVGPITKGATDSLQFTWTISLS